MKPVALLVTYTMIYPAVVGGSFFRSLRLAIELSERGWAPIICNHGPMLNDPKIHEASTKVQFVQLDLNLFGADPEKVCKFFKSFQPQVIIFGEGPFDVMKVFYNGTRMVKCPFILMDQYYSGWLVGKRWDVDLLLLSGLRCFWKDDLKLRRREVFIPPFIKTVIPRQAIPVPVHLRNLPWLTLIAYDSLILDKGINLLKALPTIAAAFITVSHVPEEANRKMITAGINSRMIVNLPLQSDANLFGLMGASRVVVISNGFLQIMEALAMAVPVICLNRGVGISTFNIDDRFRSFVSIDENEARQKQRILEWLTTSPFPPKLLSELQQERNGAYFCAELIEKVASHPPLLPMLLRQALRFGMDVNRMLNKYFS